MASQKRIKRPKAERKPAHADGQARKARRLPYVLVITLALPVVGAAGFFGWQRLRWTPSVPVPENLDQLDPQVRAYLLDKIEQTRAAPRDPERQATLALTYAANELWSEALFCFRNAAAMNPDEPLATYYQAIVTRKLGDTVGSLDLLRRVTREHPSFAPAHHRLGAALLETGATDEAASAFRRAVESAPSAPHGYVGLGDVKLRTNDYAAAARLLEKALQLDPRDRMARYLLGRAYLQLGRRAEADRQLKMGSSAQKTYIPDAWSPAVRQHAKGLANQVSYAAELVQRGFPERGIKILDKALAWHPDSVGLMNNLAIAYTRMSRHEEARELLLRAERIDDGQASTYVNLAACSMELGRLAGALSYADRAIELAPSSAKAHLTRGMILSKLQRYGDAHGALGKAAELDVMNPNMQIALGNACMRLGRYAEAKDCFVAAADLAPASWGAYLSQCRACLELGQLGEASAALAAARRIAPNHPKVLAMVELLGRQTEP